MLDKGYAQNAGVDEAAAPVTPAEAANQHGEKEAHKEHNFQVVLVLPDDDGVFIEVGYVNSAYASWILHHNHPAEMAVKEAFADGVGVLVCIGVTVMGTVVTGPPADGAFDRTATNSGEEDAEGEGGRVRCVCPEAVITWQQ